MLKEKLPIFLINTLLLYIPLLALTDRQNYRGTETHALRGLEESFFQLFCCVVLVFSSCGNKVFDLLSVCWVCVSGDYDRKKKDTVVCLTGCAAVLFFVVAGNFDYDWKKKKIQSSVFAS